MKQKEMNCINDNRKKKNSLNWKKDMTSTIGKKKHRLTAEIYY